MLTEQPELVTKVVRAMLRATRFQIGQEIRHRFLKGPWVDLGKNPEKIAARVMISRRRIFWKAAWSVKRFNVK